VWVSIEKGPTCLVLSQDVGAPIGVRTRRRFTAREIARLSGLSLDSVTKALRHLASIGVARREVVGRDQLVTEAWRPTGKAPARQAQSDAPELLAAE
jgi:hypothetical protein